MLNLIAINRSTLEKQNYVRKAPHEHDYWFSILKKKINEIVDEYQDETKFILYGNLSRELDFYAIPYWLIKSALTDETLSKDKDGVRNRWVGRVRNHILKVDNYPNHFDVSTYYGNTNGLKGITTVDLHSSEIESFDYASESRLAIVKTRTFQSKFRSKVLKNFNNECCITGIQETELLIASHIVPWAAKVESRLDPRNGLSLFTMYDSLFDKGYFTLNSDLQIIIARDLKDMSPELLSILKKIDGVSISQPKKYKLKDEYLEFHRLNVFKG